LQQKLLLHLRGDSFGGSFGLDNLQSTASLIASGGKRYRPEVLWKASVLPIAFLAGGGRVGGYGGVGSGGCSVGGVPGCGGGERSSLIGEPPFSGTGLRLSLCS
jgi:hypothetical protein